MLNRAGAIRPAAAGDIPAILELMRSLAAYEGYLNDFCVDEAALLNRAFGPDAQCEIFVADFNGQVSGYAVVLEVLFTFDLRPTLLLKELYIAEKCRGAGLGKALMQRVASLAIAKGAGRLKWDVLVGNERAETFYQQLGGRPDTKWVAYQMTWPAIDSLARSGSSNEGLP